MSLSLIVGPPNSGKAGEILIGLRKAMDRDPTLVVPTLDDADRFERELCAAGGVASGVLGVSIQRFSGCSRTSPGRREWRWRRR